MEMEQTSTSKKRPIEAGALDVEDESACKRHKSASQEEKQGKSVFTIDVGGKLFKMSVATILTENWMLSRAITGSWKTDETIPFYDADPTIFKAILFALRTQTRFQPPKSIPRAAIMQQLAFWGLNWWEAGEIIYGKPSMQNYILERLHQYMTKEALNFKNIIADLPRFMVFDKSHAADKLITFGAKCDELSWPHDVFPAYDFKEEDWLKTWKWTTDDDREIGNLLMDTKCTTLDELLRTDVGKEQEVKSTIEALQNDFAVCKKNNKFIAERYFSTRSCLLNTQFQKVFCKVATSYGISCKITTEHIDNMRDENHYCEILVPSWLFPTQPDYDTHEKELVINFGKPWQKHPLSECSNLAVIRYEFSLLLDS